MKQVVINALCDLEALRDRKVPAAYEDVKFSFEGKDYVIDLSEANYEILARALYPYIQAAKPPETVKRAAPKQKALPKGGGAEPYTPETPLSELPHMKLTRSERIAYNKGMRDWADERGEHYTNNNGFYSYPKILYVRYANYLASIS
jgi:hypothetical protein